jgi:hypothetical protein
MTVILDIPLLLPAWETGDEENNREFRKQGRAIIFFSANQQHPVLSPTLSALYTVMMTGLITHHAPNLLCTQIKKRRERTFIQIILLKHPSLPFEITHKPR